MTFHPVPESLNIYCQTPIDIFLCVLCVLCEIFVNFVVKIFYHKEHKGCTKCTIETQ